MDALSKITRDTVGRGGGGGASLDQDDGFDLDDMLPGGGSSNPKLSKTASTPSGGGTSKASDTTTKSTYTPGASTSPIGSSYKPSVGVRRSRRASALPSGGTGGGFGDPNRRRHSSVTSSLDAGKLAGLASLHDRKGKASSTDTDSDSSDNNDTGLARRGVGRGGVGAGGFGGTLSRGKGSPQGGKGDNSGEVASLKRQLAALKAEKEAMARQHEAEMTSMKSSGPNAEKEIKELGAKVRTAEEKCGRLENEVATMQLKQAEDKTLSQAKLNEQVDEMRRKHDAERREMAEGHASSVAQLKKLHIEEISSVRQRSADAQVMESLASQIKQSAATLKILENQMVSNKQAADAGIDSRNEARERLIGDMERSARESMERSESQATRLQGSVSAVEDVMRSLRNQNVEERERLKGEHAR